MAIVYKYTNKINGKVYIGQTINPQQRQRQHKSAAQNDNAFEYEKVFYRAIRKYGWDSFDYEVIAESEDSAIIDELERALIEGHNSIDEGYNIRLGGEGRQWTEEEKARHSKESQFKNAVLSEDEVIYIRKCYLSGKKPSEVYPEFEDRITHYYSFMNIWSGVRYGYVMPEVFEQRPSRVKLDFEKAQEIRKRYVEEDTSYQKLADEYGVGKCTIRDVIKFKTWNS